ncbi:META domain-containing protein [Anabaena catenula]|uniref:META domain-containing protein n=1 Tax=Anabaena catenula FACHB-362 TaxID=2692877 RepID=A0ABR8J447_9NOST|nr:META domain-containing protein [Anabaena catenula]MBD2692345.1 META domain-containing protein [Anabaena catenula FACHB-362]
MTRSFVKSAFCLPLAVVCLLGFTGKAFANDYFNISRGDYVLASGLDRKLGNSKIRIYFDGTDKIIGFTVCNNYTANYKLNRGTLAISNLVTTKKDCPNATPLDMQREAQYFDTITKLNEYTSINHEYIQLVILENRELDINLSFFKGL